jgi:hypothetical protein
MKITYFGPQLLIKDNLESTISLFKDLGFEISHDQQNVQNEDIDGIVLADPNGFKMNIIKTPNIPVDSITGIRMNVDNFEEAYELLSARGFKAPEGRDVVETKSAKVLPMIAPSGFVIELVKHIKK